MSPFARRTLSGRRPHDPATGAVPRTVLRRVLFPAITLGLAVLLAFVYGPTLINVQTVNATDWQ